jgi:hypothetical protein
MAFYPTRDGFAARAGKLIDQLKKENEKIHRVVKSTVDCCAFICAKVKLEVIIDIGLNN